MQRSPALLLMGPTGAGKSAVALAVATHIGGEIVSVDSAQVYRGMDIGTAKPSADEQGRVPHHLIDIADPDVGYSAARFVADADAAIAAIRARGATPILCGGTMLYFKALREGLSALPPADPKVRAGIDHRASREGWPALHAELARHDPAAASRIATSDAQRIQRALEVFSVAGVPLSALQGRRAGTPGQQPFIAVALVPGDRARLHKALEQRFDAMLAAGLVDELARLRSMHSLRPDMPSMRAVGYRQAYQHLDGAVDANEMRMRAIAATRQLAKRQFTWLRSTDAERFDPQALARERIVERIVERIAR